MIDNNTNKDQEIARLKAQVATLEQLLEVHKQATLEQSDRLDQALQALTKRAAELEMVTQVSAAVSITLETEKLLQEVVDLTKSRFNLYHAHIYLLNEAGNILNLTVGAGAVGRQMVAQRWSIPLAREQSLVARAARTRQGVIVNKVREAPDWLPNPLLPDTYSELAVPMIAANRVLGVLDIQSDKVNYFTDEDVYIQTTLAAQIATALENVRLFEKTETQARRLTQLNEMSAEASLATSQKDIFNIVVNRISDMLATDRITLTLLRDGDDTLEIVAYKGDEVFGGVANLLQLADTPMEIALQERRIVHSQDDLMQSVMIAPLFTGEGVLGTLNVGRFERNAFDTGNESLLQQIASILSATIKNYRLLEQTQQRAAELEEATTFLNSILDNMPAGLFVKDAENLRFVRWNKANEAIVGLSMADVLGKNDYDFFSKKEADYFTAKDREVLAKGELVDIPEEAIQTPHKGLRYLHTKKIPIFGSAGQLRYLLGISEDITEGKQAEAMLAKRAAELEETTTFLDSVIENLPTMLFVKDAEELRFVRWNKAGEELVGYPRAALIGKNDYDFFPKEEAEFFIAKDREVLAGGKLVDIPEEPIQTAHQGTRILHTTKVPILSADGQPKYLLGISEDITERKQAAETIKQSEEELQQLLEFSPEAIGVVNTKTGQFENLNIGSERLYGLSRAELLKVGPIDMSPEIQPDGRSSIEAAGGYIQAALTGGHPVFEWTHRNAQGKDIPCEIRLVALPGERNYLVRFSATDITERKKAELERERLLAEVQAAYRQYVRREWNTFLTQQYQGSWHIEHSQAGAQVEGASRHLINLQEEVVKRGQTQVVAGTLGIGRKGTPAIVTPIALRGEILGTLSLQDIDSNRQWTEDEVALIEAVSEQLALTLENLRLFDNTQQRATRELLTRQITDKMREAPDVGLIIQTGLTELAKALNVSRAYVKLTTKLGND